MSTFNTSAVPSTEPPPPARAPPIPVTVIGGPLGAGKTSLLRHVLTAQHGRRIGVIENEFSDGGSGVESLLLRAGPGGPPADGFLLELANGCVCCSGRDGLLTALERLMGARGARFDAVLVECSGMADLPTVAAVFFTDAGVGEFVLDGVVGVLDGGALGAALDGGGWSGGCDVAAVVGACDLVLLNKVDTVAGGAQRVGELTSRLRGINPGVAVVGCALAGPTPAPPPLAALLGLHAYTGRAPLPPPPPRTPTLPRSAR